MTVELSDLLDPNRVAILNHHGIQTAAHLAALLAKPDARALLSQLLDLSDHQVDDLIIALEDVAIDQTQVTRHPLGCLDDSDRMGNDE